MIFKAKLNTKKKLNKFIKKIFFLLLYHVFPFFIFIGIKAKNTLKNNLNFFIN